MEDNLVKKLKHVSHDDMVVMIAELQNALTEAANRLRPYPDPTVTPRLLVEVTRLRAHLEQIRLLCASATEGLELKDMVGEGGRFNFAGQILQTYTKPAADARAARVEWKPSRVQQIFPDDQATECPRCGEESENLFDLCNGCGGAKRTKACRNERHGQCRGCTCFCHHPDRHIDSDGDDIVGRVKARSVKTRPKVPNEHAKKNNEKAETY